jgi:ABC-type lipoprotein release transport system permease subunit
MKFRDLLDIAARNLLKLKLRTFLTIAGVVIAIAAFVAMLSFGAGNQRLVTEQYEKFGLFFTMQVYPREPESDTISPPLLDTAAVTQLGLIPGVRLAYPFDPISVQVTVGDTTFGCRAQALPAAALLTQRYSNLSAGVVFANDSTPEALVNARFLTDAGFTEADSIIGRQIVLTVRLATLDSALMHVFRDPDDRLRDRFRSFRWDSLHSVDYLRHTVRQEISKGMERFLDGFMNARKTVSDTLTICGVFDTGQFGRHRMEWIIIPTATARRLTSGGLSDDPAALFAALGEGRLPGGLSETDDRQYPRVTLDLDPNVGYDQIRDSVEALGFRTFSYLEQFAEIRQFFIYFNLALGLVGLIALVTASLGIANTLIMATIERRREIGVLKSLGADDRDIRRLFFVESGVIGVTGAALGIVFGWLVSRAGSAIAQAIMEHRDIDPVDFFAVPLWLMGAALLVGTGVAVLAGFYPAARAARIDPVEALRTE